MTTPAVNPGRGTLLKATISTVLTTVAQRVSLDGPELSVGEADTTHLDSAKKSSRPTIADPGSLSGTLFLDPQDATHSFLYSLWETPAITAFELVFADSAATTWAFSAFLTKFKPTGMEVEGNLEVEFELRLTGDITPSHS